jgi:hypothetical protein
MIEQAEGRLLQAQLELMAQGWTMDQAQMATMRAANWAGAMAAKVPPTAREETFLALLEDQLEMSGHWLEGVSEAAARDDHAEAVVRAARDGRYDRGFEKAGVEVGPQTRTAWEESLEDGSRAWREKMGGGPLA